MSSGSLPEYKDDLRRLVRRKWFFQYVEGYHKGITSTGPWNVLATFSVTTGFHQDRLLPFITVVYDFQTRSGAFLPTFTYRFNEAFSVALGVAAFWGRTEKVSMDFNEIGPPTDRQGVHAYRNGVDNLISIVRDRDEAFLRLRYTF